MSSKSSSNLTQAQKDVLKMMEEKKQNKAKSPSKVTKPVAVAARMSARTSAVKSRRPLNEPTTIKTRSSLNEVKKEEEEEEDVTERKRGRPLKRPESKLNEAQKEVLELVERKKEEMPSTSRYRIIFEEDTSSNTTKNESNEQFNRLFSKQKDISTVFSSTVQKPKPVVISLSDSEDSDDLIPDTIKRSKIARVMVAKTPSVIELRDTDDLPGSIESDVITKPLPRYLLGQILINDMEISDAVINKCLGLLKFQYQKSNDIIGFLSPSAIYTNDKYFYGFLHLDKSFVQIINLPQIHHWITLTNIGCEEKNQIRVFDSAFSLISYRDKHFLHQISRLLCYKKRPEIQVIIDSVQQQADINSCGLFAVAFALDLCIGKDPTKQHYNENEMRKHLYNCIDNDELEEFPKMKSIVCNRNALHEIILN